MSMNPHANAYEIIVWMTHVCDSSTHMYEYIYVLTHMCHSYCVWIPTRTNKSCFAFECDTSHVANLNPHTYEWVWILAQMWHMGDSWMNMTLLLCKWMSHTRVWILTHMCKWHVHICDICVIHKWVWLIDCVYECVEWVTSHVANVNESCHTTHVSHVAHTHESWKRWVMRKVNSRVMSHMFVRESCRT